MLSQKVTDMINEQINKEVYSAYLYLDMANYYSDEGLGGFENWFYVQGQEEMDHTMMFRSYLLDNGKSVKLMPIDAPAGTYSGFADPLHQSLEHERFVTASIHQIYAQAHDEKDFRTMQFLDWFVKEQGEEEKNASDLIKKYELFGGDAKGLYQLDQELSTRIHTPPNLAV